MKLKLSTPRARSELIASFAYGQASAPPVVSDDNEGATGPMLSALFRGAIRTGKRARAETAIGAAPGALVEAGTALAERALDGLAGKSALVVGAGGKASLATGHLRDRGIGELRIVNRSIERARKLAQRAGGEPGGLEMLSKALAHADLVVSSTGSAGILIGPAGVGFAARLGGLPMAFWMLAALMGLVTLSARIVTRKAA